MTDLQAPPVRAGWRPARRFLGHRAGVVSAAILTVLVVAALLGPWLWSHDHATTDLTAVRQPPSAAHPFGTDGLGRDLFARVLLGVRVSLLVALVSQVLAIGLATAIGLLAGLGHRRVDGLIMRVVDILMALPDLLLVILLVPLLTGVFGDTIAPSWLVALNAHTGGGAGLAIAIALSNWLVVARLVRAQVLSVRESEFIESAVTVGASKLRVTFVHVLPNLVTILIVAATLGIPRAVLLESGISFIGIGVSPPLPSLGSLISDGVSMMRSSPYLLVIPAVVLSAIVLSLNVFGDAIRDAVDPRSEAGAGGRTS